MNNRKNRLKSFIAATIVSTIGLGVLKSSNTSDSMVNSMIMDSTTDDMSSLYSSYSVLLNNSNYLLESVMVDGLINYFNTLDKDNIYLFNMDNIEVKEYINNYVSNYYKNNGYYYTDRYNVYDNKINYIKDKIDDLNTYSSIYGVPVPILVGLYSFKDTNDDPFNICSWKNISSSQKIYNFKTKEYEDLYNVQYNNSFKNGLKMCSMVFRQCLKESGGVIYNLSSFSNNKFDAFDYYINRNIYIDAANMSIIDINNHNKLKSLIINSMLYYIGSNEINIKYNYSQKNDYNDNYITKEINITYSDIVDVCDKEYDIVIDGLKDYVKMNIKGRSK